MMQNRHSKIYLTILLTIISLIGFAQQDNTLFFLHNIPESNFINPAVQIKCDRYIGLPLLSTFHLNVNSTGFSYKSFTKSSQIDIDKIVSKMHSWDYLTTELHYTPLSFGFRYDKYQYISFAWTEKVETKIFFPKKLFLLAKDGNTQFVGNSGLETRNPGVNAIYYREFSIGYSVKTPKNWFIGAHAKVLFGLAGVFTRRKPFNFSANQLTFNIDASWNPKINTSLPIEFSKDAQGYVPVNSVGLGTISPVGFLLNFKNQGLATDIGFIYEKDGITWSGSILDLGMIWWHDQTHKFSNNGSFNFSGATATDGMDSQAYVNSLVDSIQNQFRFKETKKGFVTVLNPRIYFGGTYPVYKTISVGAHARTELYPGRPVMGLTLSAMIIAPKGSSISVNYSVMNGSYNNVGLGFGVGGEKFQFFILSDNVMAFMFPQSARNVNLRFGFNFFSGCIDKKKEFKLPKGTNQGCNWEPTSPKKKGDSKK
ncbi:MAG: DUF5723 family protein [Tenuifilaceae bacterium]